MSQKSCKIKDFEQYCTASTHMQTFEKTEKNVYHTRIFPMTTYVVIKLCMVILYGTYLSL